MENKPKPKKNARKLDPESLLSIFFILMALFIVLMLVVLLANTAVSCAFSIFGTTTPPPASNPSAPSNPPLENAIFTGGALAQLPHTTENTRDVSADMNSSYACLLDVQSGAILAQKGGDVRFNPASMTKVMTLIVALEHLTASDLDRQLTLSMDVFEYVSTGAYAGSSCSFTPSPKKEDPYFYLNDRFLIRDVLYAIGVESAADATYMIVKEVCGDEESFVALMNQKAAELGLTNTHFGNAIGHEGEDNYTTASEMAAIMSYALQCDLIREILSRNVTYKYKGYWTDAGVEKSYDRQMDSTLFNTNDGNASRFKAYKDFYGKTFALADASMKFLGGKTGTLGDGSTQNPRIYSLVSFIEKDGKLYVAVTGETKSGYAVMNDAKTLCDYYIK